MNERIEVRFNRNGHRFRIKRQVPGGIEFDERDPIERTVLYQLRPRGEATRQRMRSVGRIQGWSPGEFRVNVSVEDGSLMLRGVNAFTLPEGLYELRLQVEEAQITPRHRNFELKHDGSGSVTFDVAFDDRDVAVALDAADPQVARVLDASTIDGIAARTWLAGTDPRATRRACLLNVLASLRTRPSLSSALLDMVHHVYRVKNDRLYARVDRGFLARLETLAGDASKPFYAEGPPRSAIHGLLLTELPEDPESRARFGGLLSFRGEGRPSLQTVIATPPADLPYSYAEFDLDLANPLQDVVGFVGHMGELLDGRSTNHLDLRKDLAGTRAGEYLYYKLV